MNHDVTCSTCGSTSVVFGTCQSTGALRFRPFGIPFLTFRTADISVKAGMCGRCGALTLIGDIDKLKQLLQYSEVAKSPVESGSNH